MEQKVKIQLSSDLEDVTKISSMTLDDALGNVSILEALINEIKRNLRHVDVLKEEDRETLKEILLKLDATRILLSKIDTRLGDTASIVSGLSSVFDKKTEDTEEEKDDNVSSR